MSSHALRPGDWPQPELPGAARLLRLNIPDMHCASCSGNIERGLSQAGFTQKIQFNLAAKNVAVEVANEVEANDLVRTIERLGFSPVELKSEAQISVALKDERKGLIARLGVAGIAMMQVMMYAFAGYVSGPEGLEPAFEALFRWASLGLAIPVVLYSAAPFYRGAINDLRNHRLGMDVPVALAITAAFVLSVANTLTASGEVYFDSVTMFTFFLLTARVVELGSRTRFQQDQALTDHLLPCQATLASGDQVATENLEVGMQVRVMAGEVFPADGVVRIGETSADESAFTGEARPCAKQFGDKVLAGSRNLDGAVVINVTTNSSGSVLNQLNELYSQATQFKPAFTRVADTVAGYFVFFILMMAVAAGTGWYVAGASNWLVIAITVLVVSCPCALSLATPVAYTIAASTLRRLGIAINDGSFIEKLAKIDTVAFDKTGTLTDGRLTLNRVLAEGMEYEQALAIAAALEANTLHPARHAFGTSDLVVASLVDVPGSGRKGCVNGAEFAIGKPGFVGLDPPDSDHYWVGLKGPGCHAWFQLGDTPREGVADVIQDIHRQQRDTWMLSGDVSGVAARFGRNLGIREVRTGLLPDEKIRAIAELQRSGKQVLMIGDGVNDAGAFGVAAASLAVAPVDTFVQSSANATLLGTSLEPIARMIRYAQRVRSVIRQNISWAVAYNFSVIPVAVAGLLEPWMAALGMSLSSIVVVLNANRLSRPGAAMQT